MLKQIPLTNAPQYTDKEMRQRATAFHVELARRRSVRDFADTPVEREVIEQCLAAAGTAPSCANLQPWHFVAVSNPELKERFVSALSTKNGNSTRTAQRRSGCKHWSHLGRMPTNLSSRLRRGSSGSSYSAGGPMRRERVERLTTTRTNRWGSQLAC